jgi:hypothetical protein
VTLQDLVPYLPVLVPSVLLAVVRVVRHVLEYRKRVLDYYVQCYVVANDSSQGLRDLAELERARRRKRRRLKSARMKGNERGSPQKSLPANPVDDRPAA